MQDSRVKNAITNNVRDALNGDEEAIKKISLLIHNIPFSSIKKLYGTNEEDYYALNILAALRFRMFNDKSALAFLTSSKNPLRKIFSPIVELLKL